MLEYKVVSQRDKTFSGAFDAAALEQELNRYAAEGWRVVDGFLTASVWKSVKAEIFVILERQRP